MKLSRRLGFALFAVATFSSFIMKYPLFKSHQGNWDSNFLLYLSKAISAHGTAPWIANWSSYFGLHKLSYPQGIPFLMSSFQQISGIFEPDSSALLFNYMEGFMAVLFSFALALAIRKKDYLFAFFVSFLFSTAPAYVQFTGWTVSGRGFIATLLPLYLLLNLFIFKKRISMRSIAFLNVFFLVVFFSIHRMAFFVLATVIPAIVLTYFFSGEGKYYQRLSGRWLSINRRERYLIGILLLSIFFYVIYSFYSQYRVVGRVKASYRSGTIISGNAVYVILINLSLEFAGSGGLLVPFAALTIFYLLKDKIKNKETLYLIIFFIFSLFLIFYQLYFRPYESLILSVFTALFFVMRIYAKSPNRRKRFSLNTKTIAVMLILAILFSGAMQIRWNKVPGPCSENPEFHSNEELTTTIRYVPERTIFVASNAPTREIALLSDKMSLSSRFYPYYVYVNNGLLKSESLNLRFHLHASWSGRLYFYSENSNFSNISEKYHNLSSYDCAVIKNGYLKTHDISNVGVLNSTYEVYSNGVYSIFFLDHSSSSISRTKVWF